MNVIDQILNEWSFRCHDGIVDMNDPTKLSILSEILVENSILNEGIDDDIRNLLANADDRTKIKILSQLKKSGKKANNDLKNILFNKGIGALVKTIIYDAEDLGQEDELLDYLHSSDQLTLGQLEKNSNLITFLEKTGLNEEFINALINITGNLGNVALGKGEVALTTLLKNAKRAEKGDIDIEGKKIEIKSGDSKAVPDTLSRGSAGDVNLSLIKLINDTFTDESVKKELIDNVSKLRAKGRWPAKVDNIYKTYLDQKQKGNTKSDFEDELNKMLKNLYKNFASEIDANNYLDQGFKADQFKLDIAKILAKAYFDQSEFDYIFYFNPANLNYKLYSGKEFLNAIGNEIKVGGFSDALPRLTYFPSEQTPELDEGAKIDFEDGAVTNIKMSNKPIKGEQLITVDGIRTTSNYKIYYSLESNPGAENIKASQDALKYDSDKINVNELKELVGKTLKNKLGKIDYIGFLESKGSLNNLLLEVVKDVYGVPDNNVVFIKKMEYDYIDNAVDWEQFQKESKTIQNAILKYLEKASKEPGPYKIRKSGEVQSSIIQRLHSKYDLGLNPNEPNKELPPIFNVIVDCLNNNKVLLMIDDNIHTGTDFLKIFKSINQLIDKMKEESLKPSDEELNASSQIQNIIGNPKFKTSSFLQDKYKELKKIENQFKERELIITKQYSNSTDNVFGYVLYRLKDSDLSS